MAHANTVRAPRARRPARRRRSTIRWDRVGRYALLAVLGTILLLYVSPARRWIAQSATAGHQQAELDELEREHDRLKARLHALKAPGALEREARRLGMGKVGERSFVVENLDR
jgi:cell division protein FtsB